MVFCLCILGCSLVRTVRRFLPTFQEVLCPSPWVIIARLGRVRSWWFAGGRQGRRHLVSVVADKSLHFVDPLPNLAWRGAMIWYNSAAVAVSKMVGSPIIDGCSVVEFAYAACISARRAIFSMQPHRALHCTSLFFALTVLAIAADVCPYILALFFPSL